MELTSLFSQNHKLKLMRLINESKNKSDYHTIHAANSLQLWNFLVILNSALSSLSILALTIETLLNTSNIVIGITGGSFTFLIAVITKIQWSYNFNCLNILHGQLSDDYKELIEEFEGLSSKLESGILDPVDYEIHIHRYIYLNEKAHLQPVNHYWFLNYFC